VEVRAEIA
jgi:hypothetical protein